MLTDLITVEDSEKILVEQKVSQFLTEAQAIEITDDDDYQYAGELLAQEKTVYKFVEKTYKKTKDALNVAKAELMNIIRAHTDPLAKAEGILKHKRGVWRTEQERIRLKEQRKIEAELRKKEEERRIEERKRLEEERKQEQIRIEAELKKQEEERRLEEAMKTGDDSALSEAIVISESNVDENMKGFEEECELEESALNEPIIIATPSVQSMPQEKGHSFRDDWKCRVIDPEKVPREYWIIDVKKIESVVKATKGTLQISGVKIWKEQIESVRSR